jgi:hypothetical protein
VLTTLAAFEYLLERTWTCNANKLTSNPTSLPICSHCSFTHLCDDVGVRLLLKDSIPGVLGVPGTLLAKPERLLLASPSDLGESFPSEFGVPLLDMFNDDG